VPAVTESPDESTVSASEMFSPAPQREHVEAASPLEAPHLQQVVAVRGVGNLEGAGKGGIHPSTDPKSRTSLELRQPAQSLDKHLGANLSVTPRTIYGHPEGGLFPVTLLANADWVNPRDFRLDAIWAPIECNFSINETNILVISLILSIICLR
jgi:hypothetical protein